MLFDPPHLVHAGEKSWLRAKYGILDRENWRADLAEGFAEGFRVLREDVVYDSWLVVISIPAYVQEREDSGTWQNVTVDFAEGNSMKRTFSVTGLWRYELWPSLAFDTAIRYHGLMQKLETGR